MVNLAWISTNAVAAEPDRKKPVIAITIKLDKDFTHPDEPVMIDDLVPKDVDYVVRTVGHVVYRIGNYDVQAGAMCNVPLHEAKQIHGIRSAFTGLPMAATSSAPWTYDVNDAKNHGIRHKIIPHKIGIYLIKSYWLTEESDLRLESSPVVLNVRPQKGADGKMVVKPKWLTDDE